MLTACRDVELEVADDASDFATKVLSAMDPVRGDGIGQSARCRVLADYAWSSRLARLDDLIARADLVRLPLSTVPPLRPLAAASTSPR